MDSETSVRRIPSVEDGSLFPLRTRQEEDKVVVNEGLEPSPNLVFPVPDQDESKPPTFPVFSPETDQEMASLGDSASVVSRVVEKIETLSLEPRDSGIPEVCFESNGGWGTKIETLCVEPRDDGISEVGFGSDGWESPRKQEDSLVAKKNQLLEEKNCEGFEGVLDVGGGILGCCLRGIGTESVRGSLKIEVIDDTALVVPVGVLKSGNVGRKAKAHGVQKKKGKMRENGENDRKKAKLLYQRKKRHGKERELMGCEKKHSCIGGAGKLGDAAKMKYSLGEMERLRFVNVAEQRKMWKWIYAGLEASVRKGYDDLTSTNHQKQKITPNFDLRRQHQRPNDNGRGILGPIVGWRRMGHQNVYVH